MRARSLRISLSLAALTAAALADGTWLGTSTCTSAPNSTGQAAEMGIFGPDHAGSGLVYMNDPVVLYAHYVPSDSLGLFFFGPMAERYLGSKRYVAFYLLCGIFGAVMYLLLNLGGFIATSVLERSVPILLVNSPWTPLIGASAGVFGVIMAGLVVFLVANFGFQLYVGKRVYAAEAGWALRSLRGTRTFIRGWRTVDLRPVMALWSLALAGLILCAVLLLLVGR